jgi:hypothetical protein
LEENELGVEKSDGLLVPTHKAMILRGNNQKITDSNDKHTGIAIMEMAGNLRVNEFYVEQNICADYKS